VRHVRHVRHMRHTRHTRHMRHVRHVRHTRHMRLGMARAGARIYALESALESVGLESMERVERDLWRGLNAMHACHMPVTCLSHACLCAPGHPRYAIPFPIQLSLSLPPYLLPSLPPSLPLPLCSVQGLPEVCASVKRDLSLSQKRTISKRCIPELRASHRTPCD